MMTFSKVNLSASKVAKEFGVSREYVYELCRRPNQNFAFQMRPNGTIYINTVAFTKYVEKNNIVKRNASF